MVSGDVQVYDNVLYSDGLTSLSSGSSSNIHVGVSFYQCTDGTGPMIAEHNLVFNPQNTPANLSYVDSLTTNAVLIAANTWGDPDFEHRDAGAGRCQLPAFNRSAPRSAWGDTATTPPIDISRSGEDRAAECRRLSESRPLICI